MADTFTYKVRDRQGKLVEGTLEADSSQLVVAKLREMGFVPIDIKQQQAKSRIDESKRIEVVVTAQHTPPQLFEKRSFVRPIMLFLLISLVTLAGIFALDNLRPRRAEEHQEYIDIREMDELWAPPEPEPVGTRNSS